MSPGRSKESKWKTFHMHRSWKSDVCSSLYPSRYSICRWETWQILDQSWDWSLEDCQEVMDTYRGPMTTCLPAGNLISCIWSDTQIQICWMYRQKEVYFRLYFPHCRKMMDLVKSSLQLYCDNRVAELYYNNNKSSAKSKHVDIKFLVIKDRV